MQMMSGAATRTRPDEASWPPFDRNGKGATGHLFDFYDPANPDLLARWDEVGRWFEAWGEVGLDPYQRVVNTSTDARP